MFLLYIHYRALGGRTMKNVYRVLAYAIAALVAFQAAVIAYALSGLGHWVQDGGTLDKAAIESGVEFPGVIGFMLHGLTGMFVIPLLALLLVIMSFFAKIPGGVTWALIVFGVVVVQVALGIFSRSLAPELSILHGINALILFGVAVTAGMRIRRAVRPASVTPDYGVPASV